MYERDRIFTAPDGREYRWVLGLAAAVRAISYLTCPIVRVLSLHQLYLNDEAETPVARFHTRRLGIFRKARQAFLEIFPAGEHIIDTIVVTFVYIEKVRKARERALRSSGGGGGGG